MASRPAAVTVAAGRDALLRERRRLADATCREITRLRASRAAADARRACCCRPTHGASLPVIVGASEDTDRLIAIIARKNAAETAAVCGFLLFIVVMLAGFLALGDDPGMASAIAALR